MLRLSSSWHICNYLSLTCSSTSIYQTLSQAKFLFANSTVMEAHYRGQHSQEIRVHAFPLYYEINYRWWWWLVICHDLSCLDLSGLVDLPWFVLSTQTTPTGTLTTRRAGWNSSSVSSVAKNSPPSKLSPRTTTSVLRMANLASLIHS